MTTDQFQRVEAALQEMLDRAPHERAAFLTAICEGDADLELEVTSLANAYEEAGDFLEAPAIATDAEVLLSSVDNRIGRVVGPYRILERLGVGGMGEVFLAKDQRLERLVALKILPAYLSDETRLHRFRKEARAASGLNHPNILTIHEVGEADGVRFIATEFIEGQTVRDLITARGLALEDALEIAMQVCVAVCAAHKAGIVHRDIKPENIMRRPDGIVKILDFGIAKLTEQTPATSAEGAPSPGYTQTEAGLVLGTVSYMSPEQARGLAVDERTDIWSVGVVLYEMLSGRMPFSRSTRLDTLVAILEHEPPPLFEPTEAVPSELLGLQRVVERTLRKEMASRYQTATELLAELKSVREDLTAAGSAMRQRMSELLSNEAFRAPVNPVSALRSSNGHDGQQALGKSLSRTSRIVGVALLLALGLAAVILYQRFSWSWNGPSTAVVAPKPYSQMSEAEKLVFIDQQEQRISALMGDRPVKLDAGSLREIKARVDRYAMRAGSSSNKQGEESLEVIYGRARPYLPTIGRSFTERKVPLIIGIYLAMIESEYQTCFESEIGAKGLYQFLPQTAEHYGVPRREMCDAEKMTPAAAHYIADRMAELGDDSQSLTLVLLSYTTGAEWVRNTLRQLRESGSYERNFWAMLANRDKLGETFRRETAGYVPLFFAAAIIGENPQVFEMALPPLSSLATDSAAPVR